MNQRLAAYYALVFLARQLTEEWVVWAVEPEIRSGKFDLRLVHPSGPFLYFLSSNVAHKVVKLVVILPVLYLVHRFAGVPWWRLAAFLVASGIGLFIAYVWGFCMAMIGLATRRVILLYTSISSIGFFFSGQFAPLALLPDPMAVIARCTPFWWAVGFPVELTGVMGEPGLHVGTGLAAQVGVAIGLYLVKAWMWPRLLRHYASVGG